MSIIAGDNVRVDLEQLHLTPQIGQSLGGVDAIWGRSGALYAPGTILDTGRPLSNGRLRVIHRTGSQCDWHTTHCTQQGGHHAHTH